MTIQDRFMDSGFESRNLRNIDTIILHSSYDALGGDPYSTEGIVKEFEIYEVSAHYLIGREGEIYQLVEDKNVAYHAGVSQVPDGRKNVNDFSLGIELVNDKENQYTHSQYEALNWLVGELKVRYSIKYVLGHNQVAPDRKTDPWNFDWKKLAI